MSAKARNAAAEASAAEKDSRAMVIGGGPIGLIAAQWLRIRGAREIAVCDVDPAKMDADAKAALDFERIVLEGVR